MTTRKEALTALRDMIRSELHAYGQAWEKTAGPVPERGGSPHEAAEEIVGEAEQALLLKITDALNVLIGAAYLDMHNMLEADAPCRPAYPETWTHEEIVRYEAGQNDAALSWQHALKKRTPIDALAALEQVKQEALRTTGQNWGESE